MRLKLGILIALLLGLSRSPNAAASCTPDYRTDVTGVSSYLVELHPMVNVYGIWFYSVSTIYITYTTVPDSSSTTCSVDITSPDDKQAYYRSNATGNQWSQGWGSVGSQDRNSTYTKQLDVTYAALGPVPEKYFTAYIVDPRNDVFSPYDFSQLKIRSWTTIHIFPSPY